MQKERLNKAVAAALGKDRQDVLPPNPSPPSPASPPNPLAGVIPTPPTVRRPEISIITCSVDDGKFNSMSAAYRIAMQGEQYEIIRISDAKGLAEGYLRGLQQSVGDIVIFSHDDAAPLRPIGAKLRRHLRVVDIVGGAGSNRLDGPAWFTAGPPHVAGQVLNQMFQPIPNADGTPQVPDAEGKLKCQIVYNLTVYGVPRRLVRNTQVMDGFWMAARRDVLKPGKAWFDQETCDGFHMYDVDFSFGAYRNGLRLGIATDLSLCHASTGGYGDPKWKPAADKWMSKYGEFLAQHQPLNWQFAAVSSGDQAAMLAKMDEILETAESEQ